jgi:pimeloyl-ACP methyl ester carboxylesterase
MPSAPAEDFLELPGGRVHLRRGGTGEPLVFLHAAGGPAWLEFHDRLVAAGFDVIAPAHPGFGKSDDFPELTAIDDLVYHYLDVLDALRLDRPHVVGASFGGWIAAELAVHSPHRIGSLTLLSAAGLQLPEAPVPDLFLMSPAKLVNALFHTPPPPPPPPAPGAPPDIDAILAATRDFAAFARFSWTPYLHNPKLERRLRRVNAPTLVAAPNDDRVIAVAHARRYAERIPGAKLVTVAECGHAMYIEKPAEFAELVTSFCRNHAPEG